jgi:hypothetical protein
MGQAFEFDLLRTLLRAVMVTALVTASLSIPARASGPDSVLLDANTLAQMELQAEHAQPREQCFLYTEVLHGLTELAGRQLQAGDEAEAGTTMQQVDVIASKLAKAAGLDSKKLKNAEQLLEHTDRRLSDMAKVASGETRAAVQEALQQVDKVHTNLLALVFAH